MYFDAPAVQDTMIIVNGLGKAPYFTEYGWNIRGLGIYEAGEPVSLKMYLNQDTIEVSDYEFYYEDLDALREWYDRLSLASVEKVESSQLKGELTADAAAELLVFSIPYDENWTVWVDGRKEELTKALDGLLAVPITPGEHSFELKYVPLGFKLGLPVTILSFLLLGMLVFYQKKSSLSLR